MQDINLIDISEKRDYIVDKIDELETNIKTKNTRDFYIGVSMDLRSVR